MKKHQNLRTNERFLLYVGIIYVGASLLGSIPYMVFGKLGLLDAIFESISAFSTTGVSVGELSPGLALWKAFCGWLGSLGCLVLLISQVPSFDIGRYAIFRSGKEHTRSAFISCAVFTLLTFILLVVDGNRAVDSAVLAFNAISSTGAQNISTADSFTVGVIAFGMIIAALNARVWLCIFKEDMDRLISNTELKVYFILIVVSSLAFFVLGGRPFDAISALTTSGFTVNGDSPQGALKIMMLLLSFAGGSTNSAAGGIKLIRIIILFRLVSRSCMVRIHPAAVVTMKINKRPLPKSVSSAAASYFLTYISVFLISCFVLSFDSATFEVAVCNSAAFLNTSGLFYTAGGALTKITGCVLMLMGRLEIYSILLMLPSLPEKHFKHREKNLY